MSRVVELNDDSEWAAVLRDSKGFGGKGLVVDFSATWCGPCQAIGPVFEKLSTQYPNIKFVKVDVDKLQGVAQECGVKAMPTFQAYFNGEQVEELVGADPSKLKAMIDKVDAMQGPGGSGQKVGGSSSTAAPSNADDLRSRMAAAAEARMRAQQGK